MPPSGLGWYSPIGPPDFAHRVSSLSYGTKYLLAFSGFSGFQDGRSLFYFPLHFSTVADTPQVLWQHMATHILKFEGGSPFNLHVLFGVCVCVLMFCYLNCCVVFMH